MHIIVNLYLFLVIIHLLAMRSLYIKKNKNKKNFGYLVLLAFLFPMIWITYFKHGRKSK